MIDNRNAVLVGGRLSLIASHCVGIGIGGTGFLNEFHYEPSLDRQVSLTGGYGGMYIEPILLPRFPVHLSFPVLFGAGGISYISTNPDLNDRFIEDSKAFLIKKSSSLITVTDQVSKVRSPATFKIRPLKGTSIAAIFDAGN